METSFNKSMNRSKRQGANEAVILSQNIGYVLENYASPLPSMVKAALNKVEEPESVSMRVDGSNGWAWLVAKRTLYIWRLTPEIGRSRPKISCHELLLPPSELFHHARLVSVVGKNPLPSCIAVSPEGHITYWNNIGLDSPTLTLNADVPGQECDSLTSVWPLGCILATTSATVLFIKLNPGPKPSLSCLSLSYGSKGWLGGLSRRMSYLMPLTSSSMETKRAHVAAPTLKEESSRTSRLSLNSTLYILSGTSFQTWTLSKDAQSCSCDENLDESLRKKFQGALWEERGDWRGLQVFLLDILWDEERKRVGVLAAVVNQSEGSGMAHYGLFTFDPKKVRESLDLTLVNLTCPKSELVDEALYRWKLLRAQNLFCMVSKNRILIVPDEQGTDFIEYDKTFGYFIGCGYATEKSISIFTSKFGLMSLRSNFQSDGLLGSLNESLYEVKVPDHLALSMTHHHLHDLTLSEDTVSVYKSAFLHYCAKRNSEASSILASLFPINNVESNEIDVWTVALCEKLVDDAPSSDSRWGAPLLRNEEGNDPMGYKSKMLIKNFLADKKKGLEIFFSFLKATGIWERLTGIVVREEEEATASVLYNLYEKIGFATALHSLQTEGKYRKYLDRGIKSIVALRVDGRGGGLNSHLSYNDVFYKDVSRVHQIIPALVSLQEQVLNEASPGPIIETVTQTTEVLLASFNELRNLSVSDKYNIVRDSFLVPFSNSSMPLNNAKKYQISPWILSPHTFESLAKQIEYLVSAYKLCGNEIEAAEIVRGLQMIIDLMLDALRVQLESLNGSQRYGEKIREFETKRGELLSKLMELDASSALPLAEKYLDFSILISVSYSSPYNERLFPYFEKYYEIGFPLFTFNWFLKHKKEGELVEIFSRSKYSGLLGEYLKNHPHIEWHHLGIVEDFNGAAITLEQMAKAEESSADDKKFYLSMAKIGLLGSGREGDECDERYERLNRELAIIRFQNELPDDAIESYGMRRDSIRVLSPPQLIDLYTTPHIQPQLENFRKAILLANFCSGAKHEKILLVLARSILCEPWGEWPVDHPLDVINSSLFFNLVISSCAEERVEDFFRLEELKSMEMLQDVFSSETGNYLLSACYEHLITLQNEQ